jgi:hypothetical protein
LLVHALTVVKDHQAMMLFSLSCVIVKTDVLAAPKVILNQLSIPQL